MDPNEKRQRGRPRSFNAPTEPASVQALDRALRILAIVAGGDGLSLSEIAEKKRPCRLHRLSNAHHARQPRHGRVWSDRPALVDGVETYRMGSAFLRRRNLVDRARSVMQQLMETTGETAISALPRMIAWSSSARSKPIRHPRLLPARHRSSFHASGIGKAIMAHLPPERVTPSSARQVSKPSPPGRLPILESLSRDLQEIKARGWSVDDEERHPGMRCIAAAIFNEFGEPVGGISVSGPTVRVTAGSRCQHRPPGA